MNFISGVLIVCQINSCNCTAHVEIYHKSVFIITGSQTPTEVPFYLSIKLDAMQ